MNEHAVTVFGGTGFLGRRVVRHLHERGFAVRIASRHPEVSRRLFGADDANRQSIAADIHDERSVIAAIAGAHGVVNAVSLYVERGQETFQSVHVAAAQRLAAAAQRAGVERFVQVSGIGADAASGSSYIRSRGEGELAVRAALPAAAIVIRPAVMFGTDDGFVTVIVRLLRRLRFCPMFGSGATRLQPVCVEDVAEAIVRVLQQTPASGTTFECGGPRVYSYEQLLRSVAREAGLKPLLVPVPFGAWHALARVAELLPNPPVARNQVELMQIDTVASPPGLAELEIVPQPIEPLVRLIAGRQGTAA